MKGKLIQKKGKKNASQFGWSDQDDLYITLAPSMGTKQTETLICFLSRDLYRIYSTTESSSHNFTDYDKRLLNAVSTMVEKAKTGSTYKRPISIHLTEDESVNTIGVSVAYSFNKKSENWHTVTISTWVSELIFAPYYIEIPKDLKKKEKIGFEMKETAPAIIHIKANNPFEFNEEKAPIIVCQWIGDFEEGTFSLKSTWVPVDKKIRDKMSSEKNYFKELQDMSETQLKGLKVYKSIVRFDGMNADWGNMTYTKINVNAVRKEYKKVQLPF